MLLLLSQLQNRILPLYHSRPRGPWLLCLASLSPLSSPRPHHNAILTLPLHKGNNHHVATVAVVRLSDCTGLDHDVQAQCFPNVQSLDPSK